MRWQQVANFLPKIHYCISNQTDKYGSESKTELKPVLVYCTGECMGSMININNGIQKPTYGYQNCNTNQKLICGGYVNVRESLCTRVIIWVNTILDHIDTTYFAQVWWFLDGL